MLGRWCRSLTKFGEHARFVIAYNFNTCLGCMLYTPPATRRACIAPLARVSDTRARTAQGMQVLPWECATAGDDGSSASTDTTLLLPVLPCMSSNAARVAKWAWHRAAQEHQRDTVAARRGLRSRRIESLRAQLRGSSEDEAPSARHAPTNEPTAAVQAVEATDESVFRPAQEHFKVPHGLWLREATSVAVDSEDRVYVFNRGNMPVMVFDVDGNLVDRWGNATPFDGDAPFPGARNSRWKGSEFIAPHAITIDHEDNLWLVDDSAHCITKCDRHGNRLMMLLPEGALLADGGSSAYADTMDASNEETAAPQAGGATSPVVLTTPEEMAAHIGQPHRPPPKHSGRMFNLPTDIAVHPATGDLFITDGYGNSHVRTRLCLCVNAVCISDLVSKLYHPFRLLSCRSRTRFTA